MLASPRLKRGKPIEKPDDSHRKAKLESFTTGIYLHSRKTSFGKIITGGVEMEDEMRLSRSIGAEAGLACAFALTALALAAPDSIAHAGGTAPVGRYRTVHHIVDSRATAEVPATPAFFLLPAFGSYVPAPRKPETDGLSRNPADCVKYGCIDSNG